MTRAAAAKAGGKGVTTNQPKITNFTSNSNGKPATDGNKKTLKNTQKGGKKQQPKRGKAKDDDDEDDDDIGDEENEDGQEQMSDPDGDEEMADDDDDDDDEEEDEDDENNAAAANNSDDDDDDDDEEGDDDGDEDEDDDADGGKKEESGAGAPAASASRGRSKRGQSSEQVDTDAAIAAALAAEEGNALNNMGRPRRAAATKKPKSEIDTWMEEEPKKKRTKKKVTPPPSAKKRSPAAKKEVDPEKERIKEEKKKAAEEKRKLNEEKKKVSDEKKKINEEKKKLREEKMKAIEQQRALAAAVPVGPEKPSVLAKLAQQYPDHYWEDWTNGAIQHISKECPLVHTSELIHPGMVVSVSWSSDGSMMATASSFGTIRVWDLETFSMLCELKDEEETQIEEFYLAKFTPDGRKIVAAGKLKDRQEWDENDEDNSCIPSAIKVFDMVTGGHPRKLIGHTEEIHTLKLIRFKGMPFMATCSQDGLVRKWMVDETWDALIKQTPMNEPDACMILDIAFVPDTGNKYIAAAADEGIIIYDFERAIRLMHFPDLYTSFCDTLRFFKPFVPMYKDGSDEPLDPDAMYLITRGVELVGVDDNNQTKPNTVDIRVLTLPTEADPDFHLETIRTLQHPSYSANVWPVRVACNGGCIAAPTTDGKIFFWGLSRGELVGIMDYQSGKNCREVTFHRNRNLFVTGSDSGTIHIYTQIFLDAKEMEERERRERELIKEKEREKDKPKSKKKKPVLSSSKPNTPTARSSAAAAAASTAASSSTPTSENVNSVPDSEMIDDTFSPQPLEEDKEMADAPQIQPVANEEQP